MKYKMKVKIKFKKEIVKLNFKVKNKERKETYKGKNLILKINDKDRIVNLFDGPLSLFSIKYHKLKVKYE